MKIKPVWSGQNAEQTWVANTPWRISTQKDVRETINVLKLLVDGSVFKSAMKEDQPNSELSLLLLTVPVKELSVEVF